MNTIVKVRRDPDADPSVPLPSYETDGAAGADIRANLPVELRAKGWILAPGAREIVPTGLRVEIPMGYEIQVRPRSGLALKHGISLPNTPGTIDSDYRGELKVLMINHGAEAFPIKRGERVAQLVLAPVTQAQWHEVAELDDTERGAGGFGSTGR